MMFLFLIGLLLLLMAAGLIYQQNASRRDEKAFPAPGALVNTSQGDMHLHCQGQGNVTVILEAGQGDCSLDWANVRSELAQFTRVCAYDRFGLGWSTPAKNIWTAQQIAKNLHQALNGAGIPGPYILVGHSIGGIYARAFAYQYPQEVAGLVFVDSAHENQRHRLPSNILKGDSILKGFAIVFRLLAPFGVARAFRLADRMQGSNYPDDIRSAAMARMYRSHFFMAFLNEIKTAELNAAQVKPPGKLGNTPIIVLSRGEKNPGLPEEEYQHLRQIWSELQQDLANLSTDSQRIVAENSGHYIHHDQPELVVSAIRQIVDRLSPAH